MGFMQVQTSPLRSENTACATLSTNVKWNMVVAQFASAALYDVDIERDPTLDMSKLGYSSVTSEHL